MVERRGYPGWILLSVHKMNRPNGFFSRTHKIGNIGIRAFLTWWRIFSITKVTSSGVFGLWIQCSSSWTILGAKLTSVCASLDFYRLGWYTSQWLQRKVANCKKHVFGSMQNLTWPCYDSKGILYNTDFTSQK